MKCGSTNKVNNFVYNLASRGYIQNSYGDYTILPSPELNTLNKQMLQMDLIPKNLRDNMEKMNNKVWFIEANNGKVDINYSLLNAISIHEAIDIDSFYEAQTKNSKYYLNFYKNTAQMFEIKYDISDPVYGEKHTQQMNTAFEAYKRYLIDEKAKKSGIPKFLYNLKKAYPDIKISLLDKDQYKSIIVSNIPGIDPAFSIESLKETVDMYREDVNYYQEPEAISIKQDINALEAQISEKMLEISQVAESFGIELDPFSTNINFNLDTEANESLSKPIMELQELLSKRDDLSLELIKKENYIENINHKPEPFEMLFAPFSRTKKEEDINEEVEEDVLKSDLSAYFNKVIAHTEQEISNLKSLIRDRKTKEDKLNLKDKNNKTQKRIIQERNKFEVEKSKLETSLVELERKNIFYLYKSLFSELDSIENSLRNKDILRDVTSRLEFLNVLVKRKGTFNPSSKSDISTSLAAWDKDKFTELSRRIDEINLLYLDSVEDITRAALDEDVLVQANLSELTEEEQENLFKANKDINYAEQMLLGATESSTKDGIIPQVIKGMLDTAKVENDAIPHQMKERLIDAAKALGTKNFDFIYEKSKFGVETGNIINWISYEFMDEVKKYINMGLKPITAENTKEDNIAAQLRWLKSNVDIIDVRKLDFIDEIFGEEDIVYTRFSQSEKQAYMKELKEKLGPVFESEIKKIRERLETYKMKRSVLLSQDPDAIKEVASIDPFRFAVNFNREDPSTTYTISDDYGNPVTVFINTHLDNLFFIPKKEIVVDSDLFGNEKTKESGYFNKEFFNMVQDPKKYEYWKAITNIYENYINPIYGKGYIGALSYGKMEEEFVEAISNADGFDKVLVSGKKLISLAQSSMFTPQTQEYSRGIQKNYTDKGDIRRKHLRKGFSIMSDEDLQKELSKAKLEHISGESRKTIIRELSNFYATKNFSKDINKVTIALTDLASYHAARQQVLPLAEMMLGFHKTILDDKGQPRVRSIARLQNYIDVIIKNITLPAGNKEVATYKSMEVVLDRMKKLPYFDKKDKVGQNMTKIYTDIDKKLLKIYKEKLETGEYDEKTTFRIGNTAYYVNKNKKSNITYFYKHTKGKDREDISETHFVEKYKQFLENEIANTGIPLTLAGVAQGINKMLIMKGLMLNPVSGVINRMEGKDTNYKMDATGIYWTPGNIEVAEQMLIGANFIKFTNRLLPKHHKHLEQLRIFRELTKKMDVIQDRKAEIDKQVAISNNDYEELLNLYQFSVDNAEYKNQGSIILSILMDTTIKDKEGNEVPIIDKEKGEFTCYELVDGKLRLKEEFRTDDNILVWEQLGVNRENIKNNGYAVLRAKAKNAISRSQGNYESTDTFVALNSILGKALFTFKRWAPAHYMQRFSTNDKDYDLFTGNKKVKGRYIAVADNLGAAVATGATALVGAVGFGGVIGFTSMGIAGFALGSYFYRRFSKNAVRSQAKQTLVFLDYIRTILASVVNYNARLLHLPSKLRLKDTLDTERTKLSLQEAGLLSAAARELGAQLSYMAYVALGYALLWDDDDDEKKQKARFIDNQMNKLIQSNEMWLSPAAFLSDMSRASAANYFKDAYKIVSILADEDKELDFYTASKITPLPRAIADLYKYGSLTSAERDYTPGQWMEKVGKNYATDGEYGRKKELKKVKDKFKEKVLEELESDPSIPKEKYNEKLRERVNKEFGRKKKGETYKEYFKRIKFEDKK